MNTSTNDPKRKALGRGLESLLPARNSAPLPAAAPAISNDPPRELPIDSIDPNPYQTRARYDEASLKELADSIAVQGVIQPVLVRPAGNGRYHLIAGERRWMASKRAGKTTIPVVVRDVSPAQAMEMTIIENLQREDLNPIEQARAYERLAREFSLTQEEMAKRTGKERASVANFLRLLKLPAEVQQKVAFGELSFGHAKVLLMLDSPQAIAETAELALKFAWSVRQTEDFVHRRLHPEPRPEKPAPRIDPNVREAQRAIQAKLGVRVNIEDRGGKGRITLDYATLEDFDRIVDALG